MTKLTVTKVMETETAHRLMDYAGKCAHIHGHSYRWEVTATALHLAENGILLDFKDLKAAMKKVIFERYDHALVLATHDPLLRYPNIQAIEQAADGTRQNIVEFDGNPTAENFARDAVMRLQMEVPAFVAITRVRVWETSNSHAEWCGEGEAAI